MPKKETTLDDLAVMVQKGFVEVEKNMARKDAMEEGFRTVNKRFEAVEKRLTIIERAVLKDYQQRIERLEDDVKWLRGQLTFGVN